MAKRWIGPAGTADEITVRGPIKAQEATLAAWLIEAPGQSIGWQHYLLAIIHLRPIEGVPLAYKRYPEAEYEMLLAACDPDLNPNPDDLQTLFPLQPVNFVSQFHGISDEQVVDMCEQFAHAIADGVLPAEFNLHGAWRDYWQRSLDKTLEHIRKGGHE